MPSVNTGLIRHLFTPQRHLTGAEDVMPASYDPNAPGQQGAYDPNAQGGGVTDTSTPQGAIASLLGSLLDTGAAAAGGGSSNPTAASVVTSAQAQAAPQTTTPTGPGPAPAKPPSTAIVPAASPKSTLMWWILGGVAAAGVVVIAWRALGHHGAKIAAKAVQAAAFWR